MALFTEPAERAKAMGVFGFVMAGGGSIGVLLGGVLTDLLSWHWIFLVNVPIGVLVYRPLAAPAPGRAGAGRARPAGRRRRRARHHLADARRLRDRQRQRERLDVGRDARAAGGAPRCCSPLFVLVESRVAAPLVPLGSLPAAERLGVERRRRPLGRGDVRVVLPLRALHAARARLQPAPGRLSPSCPANVIMGVFSIGLSAKLVMRFGIKPPLVDRARAGRRRTAPVRPRAGRRELRRPTSSRA